MAKQLLGYQQHLSQHQENSIDKSEKAWQSCNYCQNLFFKNAVDFVK